LPDIPPELAPVLDWFNANVQKLENAYNDLGKQFAAVNSELDLTNRRLEHNQRRLSALLKCMHTGVIMVDPDGRLVELNRAAESLLGVSAQDCLGHRLDDVFNLDTGVGRALRLALDSGSDEVQAERSLQLVQGVVPVAVTGSRVIDSEGELIGAMETFTDLTELKKCKLRCNKIAFCVR
jgi:PAS domain S-box-containing protein